MKERKLVQIFCDQRVDVFFKNSIKQGDATAFKTLQKVFKFDPIRNVSSKDALFSQTLLLEAIQLNKMMRPNMKLYRMF